ncbi:aldolase [Cubamyces lactineus]|nr:aldolase [Cubamyces lactineus]
MSERPSTDSPSDDPEYAPLSPAMPVSTLRGRRRSNAHDENGSSSIPVTSPAAGALTTTKTALVRGEPEHEILLRGGKPLRPATEKSSILFPTSSGPAPPVLTATHAGFADIASRLLNVPRPLSKTAASSTGSTNSPGIGRRPRPSATKTKPRDQDGQKRAIAQASRPLWRALEAKGQLVIAATLEYEREYRSRISTFHGAIVVRRRTLTIFFPVARVVLGTLPYGGTMVTPSMLREGLLTADTAYHAWVGAKRAIEERPGGEWDMAVILRKAMQFYLVELGVSMLERVEGPHYTFVDPKFHDDTPSMVGQAVRLVRLFVDKGISRDRIVITIPSTEAGVQAARTLERKHHIQTNLSLVSGLAHAAACAEAQASCITLCYKKLSEVCGRKPASNNPFIRAWEAVSGASRRAAEEAVQETAAYFKQHKLPTAVMVSNLVSVDDAERLGDFDAVALTGVQSLRARAPAPSVAPFNAGPSAKQRAKEAPHPTTYLGPGDGSFLSAMPADERTVARATLAGGLKDAVEQMLQASMHMLEFLQGEAQLAHLDDVGLQDIYEEDEEEVARLSSLVTAGDSEEQLVPIRWDDVGFRMRMSTWDKPDQLPYRAWVFDGSDQ